MKSEFIKEWERATENLKQYFVAKYFGNGATDVYWIAEQIGGVLTVNDYFFNLGDIVDFLRYKYPKDKMFDYYTYALDCYEKNTVKINIKNWIKLKENAGN